MEENNTDQEVSGFKFQHEEIQLPPDLENKTIAALYKKNLLKTNRRTFYSRWISGVAAGVSLFFAGIIWDQHNNQNLNSWSYILLLYEGEEFKISNSDDLFSEYSAWANKVRKDGIEITGERLDDEKTLIGNSFPVSINQNKLTGYFLIQSTSSKEVAEVAKKSPHIKYGGQIEIRKIATE